MDNLKNIAEVINWGAIRYDDEDQMLRKVKYLLEKESTSYIFKGRHEK